MLDSLIKKHFLLLALFVNYSLFASTEIDKEAILESTDIDALLGSRIQKVEKVEESEAPQEESTKYDKLTLISEVDLETPVYYLTEQQLLEELKFQIGQRYEIVGDFRLTLEKPWKDLELMEPDWGIVISSFPVQGLRSRFFISFEVWSSNKRHSNWQIGLVAELLKECYVATNEIERDSLLDGSAVSPKMINVLNQYSPPVESDVDLNDFVASRAIKAGTPLFMKDLKVRPLISRNSIIDVIAIDGLLRISLKGRSLQEGTRGQFIRVKNLQSHKEINAEVIGVNQARVYF